MIITDKMKLAIQQLESDFNKPVKLVTLEEAEVITGEKISGYLGVADEKDTHFLIGLSTRRPETNESSLIHEVSHCILHKKGFPIVKWDTTRLPRSINQDGIRIIKSLAGRFGSVISHPLVYRMMKEKYKIDMKTYFSGLIEEKIHMLKSKPNNGVDKVFSDQQQIIDGFEYYYYEDQSRATIQNQFKENEAQAFLACEKLYKRVNERIDIYTIEGNMKLFNLMKNRVIVYGQENGIGDLNDTYNAIHI